MTFELINSEIVYPGRAFTIRRDHLRMPDGRTTRFDIVEHHGSVVLVPMDDEGKIILAFLFNRSGKTALTESEMYLPLSMELGWFSTKEAQVFVNQAIQQELLVKKDGVLQPSFAVGQVAIPVGFTPSKKFITNEKQEEKKEEDVVHHLAAFVSEKTGRDEKKILNEIKQIEKEKHIVPAVAALLVAKRYDCELAEFFDAVETSLVKGNTR